MRYAKQNTGQKKKKNKKRNFGYLYLFTFVFLVALTGLSYVVKSYSPDVDVAIGNNESLTLSESDMDVEIKTIDERLKWIQMEDEMPSVALRNQKKIYDEEDKYNKKDNFDNKLKDEKSPPKPNMSDVSKQKLDFRLAGSSNVIPKPAVSLTKVYLGNFSTIEEAMEVQNKVTSVEAGIIPFIKAIKDYYVVQLGSFSDKEKADALALSLRNKGYSPKVVVEN